MKHPIHPMLVHFPIACWSLASCIDVFSQFLSIQDIYISGLLMLVGIILALPTMATGLFDMIKVDNDSPAIEIVNKHMLFVFITWLFYAISLYSRFDKMNFLQPDWLATLFSVIGFITLSIAGWYGGSIVYKYNVGRVE